MERKVSIVAGTRDEMKAVQAYKQLLVYYR